MGLSRKSVLNAGRERAFRELRHELLRDAGFAVTSVGSVESAERNAGKKKFDALVVGAWMTKGERNRLVRLVKDQNPQARVVFYYDDKIDGTEEADAILNARGDHEDLIRTLHHLFAKGKGRGGGRGGRSAEGVAMILVSLSSALLNLATAFAARAPLFAG